MARSSFRCRHCGNYGHPKSHCTPHKPKRRKRASHRFSKLDAACWEDDDDCASISSATSSGTSPLWDVEDYTYQPLENEESIRILELLPGERGEVVHCHLRVYRLKDVPSYEAISYAWGKKENSSNILCHNRRLNIPRNLRRALARVRKRNKIRFLWADSICIDQSNIEERGKQVQLMGSIFKGAERVLVWLGRGAVDPRDTFDRFKRWAAMIPSQGRSRKLDHTIETEPVCNWKEFNILLRCPWFHRLWIVQEICLASEGLLLCRSEQISWDDFTKVANYLNYYHDDIRRREHITGLYYVIEVAFECDFKNGKNEHLAKVLFTGVDRDCSDDRDRVYALLGHPAFRLATALQIERSPFIVADYNTISHLELYESVAEKLLNYERLDPFFLLAFVYHDGHTFPSCHNLPSWVPQWQYSSNLKISLPRDEYFHCSGGRAAEFTVDRSRLKVHGLKFDTIEWRSETLSMALLRSEDHAGNHDNTFYHLEQSWKYLREVFDQSDDDLLKTFYDTLTIGGTYEYGGLHAHEIREVSIEDRLANFLAYFHKYGVNLSFQSQCLEDSKKGNHYLFMNAAQACDNRRFFVTTKGYFGLGPKVVDKGDFVSVFFGGHVPFVLRKFPGAGEDTYKLEGECYVHGIMDGECIDMLERGDVEEQIFVIT